MATNVSIDSTEETMQSHTPRRKIGDPNPQHAGLFQTLPKDILKLMAKKN
ncbi:hypothetical protein Bealeia1_01186 [Candidatus Bealeia paramacronuclearis]|uniref:Uncharacterized protein n=1 Tax=Candidatus Bealeia paramacronuclearis TaxID=1921001 RepID=A0ABZ2C6J2_9PROT|nr:hypothetical protein [Candidatus Bealeia paramacronuclearis]